jgi:hypothetical protein
MKLGDSLAGRGLAPHIYVNAEEARAHLGEGEKDLRPPRRKKT